MALMPLTAVVQALNAAGESFFLTSLFFNRLGIFVASFNPRPCSIPDIAADLNNESAYPGNRLRGLPAGFGLARRPMRTLTSNPTGHPRPGSGTGPSAGARPGLSPRVFNFVFQLTLERRRRGCFAPRGQTFCAVNL